MTTTHLRLPAAEQASCGLAYVPIQAAQARLAAAAEQNAPAVFDEDLARRVKPALKAAGITVRPPGPPPKPKGKR